MCVRFWPNAKIKDFKFLADRILYAFCIDNKTVGLNIYQKDDGSTTIIATGKNQDVSKLLLTEIYKVSYHRDIKQKNYSMMVGEVWIKQAVAYLKELCERNS